MPGVSEVYLATIMVPEVGEETGVEGILMVEDFEDIFEALVGPPQLREEHFTIKLEPDARSISTAPYRMAPT